MFGVPLKYYFLMLLFMCSNILHAQKVGLVLSGGGAKGMAHIGVIKALEENNIPIDYITGTSIGAIVGGLYASGYSIDEMEELFKSKNFKLWSTGKIPPKFVYYYKKLNATPALVDLDFYRKQEKLKLILPTNIIRQEQLDFGILELFSSVNAVTNYDFDNLFIPFRCVATDVYLNEAVVFRNGDIGTAIRASMTYPFYFKPIEENGVLLFDGGLVNNFPADIMIKDFNPDIIIGSKVASNNKRPHKDDLFGQIGNMIMRKTDYSLPDSIGIFIETEIPNIGVLDFDRFDELEKAGYDNTLKNLTEIKDKISRRVSANDLGQRRDKFNSLKPQLLFNNIMVTGVDYQQRYYIANSIRNKSKTMSLDKLRLEYFKLAADNHLKSVYPKAFINNDTGYFDLLLKVEPQQPLSVGLGGYFSLSDVNQGYVGIDYKLLRKQSYTFQSNIHFGKFYSSFLLGSRIDFATRQPFSMELYWSINRWNYFSGSSEIFFTKELPYYVIRDENNIRYDFAIPVGTRGKWVFGIEYSNSRDDYFQTRDFEKGSSPDHTQFLNGNIHGRYEQITFNKKNYPTEGSLIRFETMLVSGIEKEIPGTYSSNNGIYEKKHQFFQALLMFDQYFLTTSWLTLGLSVDAFYSNRDFFNNYTSTIISAKSFSPTLHSKTMFLPNFRANQFGAVGVKTIIPVTPSTHIRFEGYYFQPIKGIRSDVNNNPVLDNKIFMNDYFMGAAGFVTHTPVGPATILLNYYSEEQPSLFIQMSFGFLIFNRRNY
jgi:NTE family protein